MWYFFNYYNSIPNIFLMTFKKNRYHRVYRFIRKLVKFSLVRCCVLVSKIFKKKKKSSPFSCNCSKFHYAFLISRYWVNSFLKYHNWQWNTLYLRPWLTENITWFISNLSVLPRKQGNFQKHRFKNILTSFDAASFFKVCFDFKAY